MNKSVIKHLSDNAKASDLLSAILGADHVNSNELLLCRQWAFIFESSYKFGSNLCSFAAGSRIECSVSPESDEDQMLQMRDTEVISNADDATMAGNILIMEMSNSPPGYTLLRLYKSSSNMNLPETKGCLQSLVQLKNVNFLSSEEYLRFHMGYIAGIHKFCPPSFQADESLLNGPCVRFNYTKNGKDLDIAIGLKCSSWPTESLEWVKRHRKSNWPNKQLVNKIKQMPCHVLPIGYPESDKHYLQWRFAYILPERELMWNLTDVQIQCFVIFKTLTKEWLDPIAPEQISSFHLKTILFWLSEEIVYWTSQQLIDNVQKCLEYLYKAIKERHLSHYFMRSRNLFAGKLHNDATRAKLQSKILQLQRNVISFFLQSNWQYRRGGMLLSIVRSVNYNISENEFWTICIAILKNGKDKFKRNKHSHAKGLSLEVALTLMYLKSTKEILVKVAEEIKKELKGTLMASNAVKFLSLRIGMIYLAEVNNTADKEKRHHLADAKRFFDTGQEHDTLAASMYLLTYHYQTGDYITVKKYLKDLFGKRLAIQYAGTPGFNDPGNRVLISPDMYEGFSDEDITNTNSIAFDVLFSCSDRVCVPPAIQQECALLGAPLNWPFCAINPLVYASYMQFQVAANLGDVDEVIMAINHLCEMVAYTKGGKGDKSADNYRHYNILGYCYYINNDVRNAMHWFNKSWQICPTVGNAASKYVTRYST